MLNQVLLVGRVVEVPEIKETQSGKRVSNFIVAVPRDYPNKEGIYETDFIDCTAWNNKADKLEHFIVGDLVLVNAKVQVNSYEKNGEKVRETDLIVKDVDFLSHSKKEIQRQLNNEEQETSHDDFDLDMDR